MTIALIEKNFNKTKRIRVKNLSVNQTIEQISYKLKSSFPLKNPGFYSSIKKAFEESFIKSKTTSFFLIISEKNASENAECASANLMKILKPNINLNYLNFDSREVSNFTSNNAKLTLEEKLLKKLSNKKHRFFLIKNINRLPFQAVRLLSDFYQSSYPSVIFILTLELKEQLTDAQRINFENNSEELKQYIQKEFAALWANDATNEELQSLFTIISNNAFLLDRSYYCKKF